MTIEMLNLGISVLALIAAIYAIYYTHRFNRRKLSVDSCNFCIDDVDPPLYWLKIHNISPVPISLDSITFRTLDGQEILPLNDYEPAQTYSESPASIMGYMTPNIIPDFKYAEPLEQNTVIQPYSSLEISYYFDAIHTDMLVKITCKEIIHCLKKHKLFLCHFSEIKN